MRGLAAFLFSVLALVWAGAAAADDPKSWGEATSGLTRADGFLPYYADVKGGRILTAFPAPDEEGVSLRAIQATGLTAGLGSNPIGLDRGLFDGGSLIAFRRVGKKLIAEQENWVYVASADNPLVRRCDCGKRQRRAAGGYFRLSHARRAGCERRAEAQSEGRGLLAGC
jgi:hypothetical protein